MAILDMKKCTIVGYDADKEKLIKTLHRSCIFEVVKSEELENASYGDESKSKEEVNQKIAKLNFAFDFLKVQKRTGNKIVKDNGKKKNIKNGKTVDISYKPAKKQLIKTPVYIEYNDFMNSPSKEQSVFSAISDLEKINADLQEIKTSEIKLKNLIDGLSIYEDMDVPFSTVKDTQNVNVLLGVMPTQNLSVLDTLKDEYQVVDSEVIKNDVKYTSLLIACHKDFSQEFTSRLISDCEFTRCSYAFDLTAKEKIEECKNTLKANEKKKVTLLDESLKYLSYEEDFKQLYDYYSFENQKLDAKEDMMLTGSTFVIEGWIPSEEQQKFEEALNKTSEYLFVEFREPTKDEVPPTLCKNNKVVAPFEAVTNMYSAPYPTEFDPNPLMAFFFFIFFGFMVSDAAYGLILTVGAMLLYKLTKPAKGKGKLILLVMFGGISTFIWGMIFGGWFGETWHPLIPSLVPMENPMGVLILALGLGVVHIMYGMAINGVRLIKQKKYIESIVETWDWFFIYIGLFLFAGNMLLKLNSEGMKIAGLTLAGIGLATLLILGGHGKKGFGRIFGGVAKLYDIVNFLSDVLSYSRLFGLGLATGIVGMVFNQIGMVMVDLLSFNIVGSIIGWIVAIVVMVAGHVFNIGINTLGAYVHDCRLQYIEFYGKFYQGGGHLFNPLGAKIKYNNVKM